MTTDEMVSDLTQGMYDAKGLAEELTICRDLMARYYLAASEDYNKQECWCHYENLSHLVTLLKK